MTSEATVGMIKFKDRKALVLGVAPLTHLYAFVISHNSTASNIVSHVMSLVFSRANMVLIRATKLKKIFVGRRKAKVA